MIYNKRHIQLLKLSTILYWFVFYLRMFKGYIGTVNMKNDGCKICLILIIFWDEKQIQ